MGGHDGPMSDRDGEDEGAGGRRETADERADRNWSDLLQEFRVLQTGVQILAGFLLTLPFQAAFTDLDGTQRALYVVLVLLAFVTTTLLVLPIAVHRRLFRLQRKGQLVRVGHVVARFVLGAVSLLIVGLATFVVDIVLGRTASVVVCLGMAVAVIAATIVVPALVGRRVSSH